VTTAGEIAYDVAWSSACMTAFAKHWAECSPVEKLAQLEVVPASRFEPTRRQVAAQVAALFPESSGLIAKSLGVPLPVPVAKSASPQRHLSAKEADHVRAVFEDAAARRRALGKSAPVTPRSPIPDILAASPKQRDPMREDVRVRLAAAWSTHPRQDIDTFVLNARALDPALRRLTANDVLRVAREMNLRFDEQPAGVAKSTASVGRILKQELAGTFDAPEQVRLADAMMQLAAERLADMHAARRPQGWRA
jgi:hypothetical protein